MIKILIYGIIYPVYPVILSKTNYVAYGDSICSAGVPPALKTAGETPALPIN